LGNPLGWPTTGQSRHPVLSTIGTVWSYTYWEDNSDGYDDIYGITYYNPGRPFYKFRDVHGYEDMHCPNVTNCYVVWTQGDAPPYKVMFACEGYPIAVEEKEDRESLSPGISLSPNPFSSEVRIQISGIRRQKTDDRGQNLLRIYDASGRKIREISLGAKATWDGRDEDGDVVRAGIYFIKVDEFAPEKVIKIR
jgi:hypothetical protein